MANRAFANQAFTSIKGRVTLWARVTIGATGAPTLTKFNPVDATFSSAPTTGSGPYAIGAEAIKSISRSATGTYVVVLQDRYRRLLSLGLTVANATGAPTAFGCGLWTTGTDVTSATSPQVKFSTLSSTGTVADPASGDVLNLCFELQNSSVI